VAIWRSALESLDIMSFWLDKRVLITGHTGFKGSWLTLALLESGAMVFGFALEAEQFSLFNQLSNIGRIDSCIGDIRDRKKLTKNIAKVQPDIIFHLAAQPLVLASYEKPYETFDVNLMGTASLLEAAFDAGFEGTLVMVTSDKVYENNNSGHKFEENDRLGGGDPYSASKAGSEFIIKSYGETIFSTNGKIKLVSARSGNVIGGGDWASNRVIPDIIRSIETKEVLQVRSPNSTRPWMHVLDTINGYLKLASHISSSGQFGYNGSYNFGPNTGSYSVENILEELSKYFKVNWIAKDTSKGCQEAVELGLNSKKARDQLGWEPLFQFSKAVECTAQWYLAYLSGEVMDEFTRRQIASFLGGNK